jgi:UDP-glucuronate 4-epimerase
MKKIILVTGSAGFIGFHISKLLLKNNFRVIGIDNLNNYYSVSLKKGRNKELNSFKNYTFIKADICKKEAIIKICKKFKVNYILHLAAQAGVRNSIKNPDIYIKSNLTGFFNVIDAARLCKIKHFVYASSSSVYGINKKKSFKESDLTDHPSSLYGATKKSNEIIAHSYSYIYGLPVTGLRFFTVYGPYGRPDMSLFLFVKKILENKKIEIFNYGRMRRSFTYVDDVVRAVAKILFKIPRYQKKKKKLTSDVSTAPFQIYNLGNPNDVGLIDYVKKIEFYLKKTPKKNFLDLQLGDVISTKANIGKIKKDINYRINKNINFGIINFIDWYKKYFKIN